MTDQKKVLPITFVKQKTKKNLPVTYKEKLQYPYRVNSHDNFHLITGVGALCFLVSALVQLDWKELLISQKTVLEYILHHSFYLHKL